MKVAESNPASCPSVASSTSTVKPRRSAQRWYIRRSTSVQSWASVPPAPACTSHTASNSSYSPENNDCSSKAPSRVPSASTVSTSSASSAASPVPSPEDSSASSSSARASSSTLRSVSSCSRSAETRPSSLVTTRALSASSQRSGRATSASSSARRTSSLSRPRYRSASASRSPSAASSDVKSRGSSAAGPSGRAMTELELLAAPAPAGVVAADLLVLFLHDGHQRLGVGRVGTLDLCLASRCPSVAGGNRVGGPVQHRRLRRHVRPLVRQQCGRHGPGLGHRVLGGGVDRPVEVGLDRGLLDRLDMEDVAEIVVVDHLDQLAEHVEALRLPCVEG